MSINKYFNLLIKKKKLQRQLQDEKQKLHEKFVAMNRKTFIFMDVMVILMVIFNFGAVILTNMMVVYQTPDIKFYEANPIQREIHDMEEPPEERKGREIKVQKAILVQSSFWFVLLSIYFYNRRNVFSMPHLYLLIILVSFYFVMLGYDFFNDLGYFLGTVVF